MISFVHIKEFDSATGAIDPDSVKPSDAVRVEVESTIFSASASTAPFLYSDFVVTADTEISVTFLNSYCTLQNTLVFFTYAAGEYPATLADASSVIVVMPRANKIGIQAGDRIRLPYSFTRAMYRNKDKVDGVSNYVFPQHTRLGFALIAKLFNYIKMDTHDVLDDHNIGVFALDATRNNERALASRSHAKGVQYNDTRWFLGFEDINRDDPACDHDFNDVIFELETSTANSLNVLSTSTVPTLPSVYVQLSSADIATLGGTNLSAEYSQHFENQYLNENGVLTVGGTHLCFGSTDQVMWSVQANAWVLRQATTGVTTPVGTRDRNVPARSELGATGSSLRYSPVPTSRFGTVRNATDNSVVAGAVVILRDGSNNEIRRVTCNSAGYYVATYDTLDYNVGVIQFQHHGFVDVYQTPFTSEVNVSLVPTSVIPHFRAVLTWGTLPTDLDSHLKASTSGFHISYANTTATRGSTVASLDVDDVTSFGPETISVVNPTTETYKYYVHNWSNEKSLSASREAEVRVYQNNTLVRTVNIAGALNSRNSNARYWHVFDITNGVVQVVHAFVTAEPN